MRSGSSPARSPTREQTRQKLERILGVKFKNTALLEEALTHKSYAMEKGGRLILETAHVDVPAGADVRRNALAPGSYLMLRVTDSGCGMSAEVQAHAFEPFFTTKEPGKGTGLGLSTVYGIVKQSGGTILLDSVPGTGTTFRIFLPVVERRVPRVRQADANAHLSRPTETILLVEDEKVVRGLSRKTLQAAGYAVLEAASPREALRISERHEGTIHLIVDVRQWVEKHRKVS